MKKLFLFLNLIFFILAGRLPSFCSETTSLKPTPDYSLLLTQSQEYLKQGRYSEAISVYDNLLESFPENADIHYLRGILSHKSGDLNRAIKDYSFLLEQRKADAKIINNLATIYAQNKEYEKAKILFEQALATGSAPNETHSNLAKLCMETKDYASAVREYTNYIIREPNDSTALNELGLAYALQGYFPQARSQWQKTLTIDAENSEAKIWLENTKSKE